MTPYAITITRQFGSKGREIGKQLAELLKRTKVWQHWLL